jgi:hypothetical protein
MIKRLFLFYVKGDKLMNRKKYIPILITLLIVSMMSVSIATAEAPRAYFTATSNMIEFLDPGTTVVHDNHVHVSGMKQAFLTCWTFVENGESVCHREVVEINIVLSLVDLTGNMWGTFEFLDDGTEVWEGTFHGSRRIVDGNMVSTVNDVGRGLGPNEGLLFQYTLQAFNIWDPSVPATFTGTGFVQETGKYNP